MPQIGLYNNYSILGWPHILVRKFQNNYFKFQVFENNCTHNLFDKQFHEKLVVYKLSFKWVKTLEFALNDVKLKDTAPPPGAAVDKF